MTKIMLVEDDKSLREIYGVRLLAEGYDIVSAGDGEEALAMAIKERPQLIVSDVMMPKISGFDMLDILRSTTETKNIKVIMMTALSSEEQRQRGESLGADRYLVKSQVGIEDVVRVVHEVLEDSTAQAAPAQATTPAPAPQPAADMPKPVSVPPRPVTPPAPAPPVPTPAPPHAPAPAITAPKPASIKTRVIEPLNDPANKPVDMSELLDKELAKEAGVEGDDIPTIQTTDQERETLEKELANFEANSANEITADPSMSFDSTDDKSSSVPPPPPPPPAPTQ
jgi:CheY-like chemotaxis protein